MQSLALRASHFSLHFSQKYCEKRKIDYANNFLQGLAFLRKKHNFKLTLVRKKSTLIYLILALQQFCSNKTLQGNFLWGIKLDIIHFSLNISEGADEKICQIIKSLFSLSSFPSFLRP